MVQTSPATRGTRMAITPSKIRSWKTKVQKIILQDEIIKNFGFRRKATTISSLMLIGWENLIEITSKEPWEIEWRKGRERILKQVLVRKTLGIINNR